MTRFVKTFPISLFLMIILSSCGFTQPGAVSKKNMKKAEKLTEQGTELNQERNWGAALAKFEEAISYWPEYGLANYKAATIYYSNRRYDEAYSHFVTAEDNLEEIPPRLYFYLGDIYFARDEFEDSYQNFAKYLELMPTDKPYFHKNAVKKMEKAEFAKEAMKDRIEFEPVNLGRDVNSMFEDYMPYLTADDSRIFFTSRRPGGIGEEDPRTGMFPEDFYYAERTESGGWGPAFNLGPPVNTKGNEGAACFTPDGQFVFFTACNREDGLGSCDLYMSELNGNNWSTPENLGSAINSDFWDSQPSVSGDGRSLYFVSNRPGGVGGYDIWVSRKVGGKWQPAENLGKPVNSGKGEYSPFMHADGKTLYFSSDGHPGFGATDIFMSTFSGGEWSQPKNLGYPLNTAAEETHLFINSTGTMGYINSRREGGMGKMDLYQFELDEKIRPKSATFVRGDVFDKISLERIGATVTFLNATTGDTIRDVTANKKTGKFLLNLPLDQEYIAYIEQKGYLFHTQTFSLRDLNADVEYFDLSIPLEPIKAEGGQTLVLDNIFYETNKYKLKSESKAALEHLLGFLKLNPDLRVEIAGHTDDVGASDYNQLLSENRAGEVRRFLIDRGITENRVISRGYGENEPICLTGGEDCNAKNRRTELRILGN